MQVLRNILYFLLFFLFGFFAGIFVADLTEAGKGQMLAAAAIVLGYGVIGAFLGLVTAALLYFTTLKFKPSIRTLISKVLAVLLLALVATFWVKYLQREAERKERLGMNLPYNQILINDSENLTPALSTNTK